MHNKTWQVFFTESDRLMYEIKTENVYEGI